MAASPSLNSEKKYWWLTNRKIVEKYLKDAKILIQTQETSNVNAALSLIDSALALSPKCEAALELKARSLLFLRRFRDVADMLQDYIPSFKLISDDDSSNSSGSNDPNSKLLRHNEEKDGESDRSFSCFYVSDLKKKVMAGLNGNSNKEGHWRYLILGQACSHLGLMEDAMVLLQTARRLAAASFRRKSTQLSDDTFAFLPPPQSSSTPNPNRTPNYQNAPPLPDFETASQLLSHIKLLLRRRTAALSALDAGLPSESIRHFSKILESRSGNPGSGTPSTFASMCYISRASAYRSANRPADAISDCNRALALDPTSIPALCARADLLESICALPDCVRDLDHLKILYDSILRDRKLPGPAWKPHHEVRFRDIPSCLRALTVRVQELRLRVRSDDGCDKVDYFKLFGVKRGCTRSELERAYLLLCLKHKPDKATAFIDRLEFGDGYRDFETIRDQARMSAWILYRMLQKGYKVVLSIVMEEEAVEKKRVADLVTAKVKIVKENNVNVGERVADLGTAKAKIVKENNVKVGEKAAVYQGVFCRDLAVVGSMLSGVGFSGAIPVKYEGLSC